MENTVIATITAEQVRTAVLVAGFEPTTMLAPRPCSMCHSHVGYYVRGGELVFDSNCECTNYWSQPTLRSWESLAEFFNMQSDPESRAKLMAEFNLNVDGSPIAVHESEPSGTLVTVLLDTNNHGLTSSLGLRNQPSILSDVVTISGCSPTGTGRRNCRVLDNNGVLRTVDIEVVDQHNGQSMLAVAIDGVVIDLFSARPK